MPRPRLPPARERFERLVHRWCTQCLGEGPDIAQLTSEVAGGFARTRGTRGIKQSLSEISQWMTWWETTDQRERPSTVHSVEAYVRYLEASGRVPCSRRKAIDFVFRFLAALGWPDRGAARVLKCSARRHAVLKRPAARRSARAAPVGWSEIQSCLDVVDAKNDREVQAAAAMLVLYDSMAREDALFGLRDGPNWRISPPTVADLRFQPDGSGCLRLRAPTRFACYFDAILTPLTMTWLSRALRPRRNADGPLLLSPLELPWSAERWRLTATEVLRRAHIADRIVTGRSIRVGKVLDLAASGLSVEEIQRAGFWTKIRPVERILAQRDLASDGEPITGDLFGADSLAAAHWSPRAAARSRATEPHKRLGRRNRPAGRPVSLPLTPHAENP